MNFQNHKKISIITISRNSAAFIEQTLNSVINQNYTALEYLVVDGGSTDGTTDIIKKYADMDDRIFWVSEPDRGISDAMNKGIAMASGDILCHLHADDYYPDRDVLSTVAAAFSAKPDALWLTGSAYFVNSKSKLLREIRVKNCTFSKLRRVNCIIHPATFIRRELFERAGVFDVSLKYAMDYDLWLRLGEIADPIRIDKPLASFRVHEGSLSISRAEEAFAEEHAIRRKFLEKSLFRKCINNLYFFIMKRINRHYMNKLRSCC